MSGKREACDDDMGDNEGPAKRARSGGRAVDVRFLVQSKNAGAIIGKGGSNINRLRTEFKASVTVPDCPGPERILSIVADIDTLAEILLDVLPKLEDYSHHRSMEFECELRMLLHQSHAGCLIGKGGSRIKELREKTGSQIKIFSNCCPNSTERIVQITGYPNVVVNCVKEVCNIIGQAPIKGPNKQYDPHNCNPMFANEYGGYEDTGSKGRGGRGFGGRGNRGGPPAWRDDVVDNFGFGGPGGSPRGSRGGYGGGSVGPRGRGLMGQGPGMGSRDQWGGPGGGMDRPWANDDVGFGGGRNQMLGMNGAGGDGYMSRGGMGDNMRGSMGGPRGPMMQGGGSSGGMGGYRGPSSINGPGGSGYMGDGGRRSGGGGYGPPIPGTGELFTAKPISNPNGSGSIRMKIPNDVAGAIIGKGGQRIRKIRRDSAATINIEEASQGSNERIITITGQFGQVQMAQQLMQQSIRDGGRRF